MVLGAPNWIVPGAEMEATYFPQSADIIALVAQQFYPDVDVDTSSHRESDTFSLAKLGL